MIQWYQIWIYFHKSFWLIIDFMKLSDIKGSSEDGCLKVFHKCLWNTLFLGCILIFRPVPRFKPKLHLFHVNEIILAHWQPAANRVNLIFLDISHLSQTYSHLIKGHHIFALNLIVRFWLTFLFNQLHNLFYLTLA